VHCCAALQEILLEMEHCILQKHHANTTALSHNRTQIAKLPEFSDQIEDRFEGGRA